MKVSLKEPRNPTFWTVLTGLLRSEGEIRLLPGDSFVNQVWKLVKVIHQCDHVSINKVLWRQSTTKQISSNLRTEYGREIFRLSIPLIISGSAYNHVNACCTKQHSYLLNFVDDACCIVHLCLSCENDRAGACAGNAGWVIQAISGYSPSS